MIPWAALFMVAFCSVIGALFGHALIGLAVGLGVCVLATIVNAKS